ncbi:MAG TPA: serine hydrolase, partial [Acidimicrobiia bacterium]|nr:serine hydrolase [Acidimicrobiia bacterium]
RTPAALDAPIPAANGTFTARSITRLAAALAGGGVIDGVRVLSATTLARATEIQHDRVDLVVGFPMLWRLGYHVAYTTAGGILPGAFGHTGFGGSGAWADPERDLAMCFIPSALGTGLAMDLRFLKLGGRAVRAVDARDG